VIIELQDNTNAVINTSTFAVSAAQINQRVFVPLNFSLTPATGMQLVRNVASVNLWRNNVGVTYPYDLPGYLSITTSTAGNGFYYFFYDWQVSTPSANYAFAWSSIPVGYTGTGDTAFVSPTVNTQYIVNVTDMVSGCTSQFSTMINMAAPLGVTVSGAASVCTGDSALLVATVSGGDGNVSYLWSTTSTNDSIWVMPASATTYSITITDGCGSTASNTQNVAVSTVAPTGTFTVSATGVMTYTFTDATTNTVTYAWDFGDLGTSTSASPTHTYAAQGTYTVTLIASNGCGADTITQVITVTGIEMMDLSNSLSIYPNPAHESFTLSVSGISNTAQVELFDLEGHLIFSRELSKAECTNGYAIDVHSFAAGMYMLKVGTERGDVVKKVVVE
jgi:PKD repeat protein